MPAVEARDTKTFASATELKASYAATRARLMQKPALVQEPAPIAQVAPVAAVAEVATVAPPEPEVPPLPIPDAIRDVVVAVAQATGIAPSVLLGGLSAPATRARRIAIAIARRRGIAFVARRFGVGAGTVKDAARILDAILLQKAIPPRLAPLEELAATVAAMWDDFDRPPSCAIPIGEIKRIVADVFGVEIRDLDSARRTLPMVRARHVAMGLAKRFTLRSLPEIGRQFGGRDHTTVLHAVAKYKPVIDRVGATMPASASVRDWALALRHAIAPWQGKL